LFEGGVIKVVKESRKMNKLRNRREIKNFPENQKLREFNTPEFFGLTRSSKGNSSS
jgi:hypothetical protein